jgi:uncharacterized protein (DUF1015 family)
MNLYDDCEVKDLSPVVQKLNAFLIADGFKRTRAGKKIGSGFSNDITVNEAKYCRGDENVFIITNYPEGA